jgi:hypothetical protein
MGVMCRVGTVNYLASGECGGGRSSGVKDMGRQGKEDRRREWKKREEKIVGRQKGK